MLTLGSLSVCAYVLIFGLPFPVWTALVSSLGPNVPNIHPPSSPTFARKTRSKTNGLAVHPRLAGRPQTNAAQRPCRAIGHR